jgi:hypothetical protein
MNSNTAIRRISAQGHRDYVPRQHVLDGSGLRAWPFAVGVPLNKGELSGGAMCPDLT